MTILQTWLMKISSNLCLAGKMLESSWDQVVNCPQRENCTRKMVGSCFSPDNASLSTFKPCGSFYHSFKQFLNNETPRWDGACPHPNFHVQVNPYIQLQILRSSCNGCQFEIYVSIGKDSWWHTITRRQKRCVSSFATLEEKFLQNINVTDK